MSAAVSRTSPDSDRDPQEILSSPHDNGPLVHRRSPATPPMRLDSSRFALLRHPPQREVRRLRLVGPDGSYQARSGSELSVAFGGNAQWHNATTIHARSGSPATLDGTGAPASWTPDGCRPVSAVGPSTPASGPCASPTAPTASTWTGCTPAAALRRPEHGHGVLAAATAVLTGSPGPRDGGGRSERAMPLTRDRTGSLP
jgi:hypothetical protein